MNRRQFHIRDLFIVAAIIAASIVALQLFSQHAGTIAATTFIIATATSLTTGLCGFCIAVYAGLLIIATLCDSKHAARQENLNRYLKQAGIGFAMVIASLLVLYLLVCIVVSLDT